MAAVRVEHLPPRGDRLDLTLGVCRVSVQSYGCVDGLFDKISLKKHGCADGLAQPDEHGLRDHSDARMRAQSHGCNAASPALVERRERQVGRKSRGQRHGWIREVSIWARAHQVVRESRSIHELGSAAPGRNTDERIGRREVSSVARVKRREGDVTKQDSGAPQLIEERAAALTLPKLGERHSEQRSIPERGRGYVKDFGVGAQ
eukprot:4227106-Prymnesium_polylepis.1